MKVFPASRFIIFIFVMLPLLTKGQAKVRYSPEIEARIALVEKSLGEEIRTSDDPIFLSDRMKYYGVPAVSIAVIKNFRVEWVRTYGFADKEANVPATPETLFQAASISKSVNALGVLMLFGRRKLDLDADINTFLKTWRFPYDSAKGKKTITMRNLLSHTAGTSVHGFRGYAAGEPLPTITQILDGEKPANSAAIRSMFDAGTRVQYSGGGTTISQLITMDLTGKPYDVYMAENVMKPLGMNSSFYTVPAPASKLPLLSTGYRDDGKPVDGKYHSYPEQAAAGLWTNPTELARFIIEIQLALHGKSRVITQATAKEMMKPVMLENALGVFVIREKYFSHNGANEGFRCRYVGSLTGGDGVVVMVNSDNGAIVQEIANSVATVYGWVDYYNPIRKTVVSVSDEILDSYTGEYEIAPTFRITIRREGHALKAEATNQGEADLFAESENRFFLKVVNAQIEFRKDESGKISKLVLIQNGREMEGRRISQ